jgi:hypothetical protein
VTTASVLTTEQSGVYRTPGALSAVQASATAAGAVWFDIDAGRARFKEQVLGAFATACGFPRSFGHNWDALADALQDLSWRPARGYVLHLKHTPAAARALKGDWFMLLEVLDETAMYWKDKAKAFIVFVDDAPDLPQWP